MKYLTKEWLLKYELSFVNRLTKKAKRAETFNEKFYRQVYAQAYGKWRAIEKNLPIYRDPQEDLKKIEDYINERGIDEEEQRRRKNFKKNYLELERERIEKGIFFPFDEERAKNKFKKNINYKIKLYEHFPQEVLDRIADIRVFALHYASAEAKKILRPVCAKFRRDCEKMQDIAAEETRKAEKYLSQTLELNLIGETLLEEIKEENGGIYLYFENKNCLFINNGKILERETNNIYRYDAYDPYSGWSMICAAELYYIEGEFELHFLISNIDEEYNKNLWYLTIRGNDIKEICD